MDEPSCGGIRVGGPCGCFFGVSVTRVCFRVQEHCTSLRTLVQSACRHHTHSYSCSVPQKTPLPLPSQCVVQRSAVFACAERNECCKQKDSTGCRPDCSFDSIMYITTVAAAGCCKHRLQPQGPSVVRHGDLIGSWACEPCRLAQLICWGIISL